MMQVDLILFAGQSNMAGRGVTSERWPEKAPPVIDGAGWEYRAVSAPGRLWPITEPFGVEENRPEGIDDRWGEVRAKTGSLVSAFVNAYYRECGVPVIAVSASKGGSAIAEWQPGGAYLTDAMTRLSDARQWLIVNGYEIRHVFCAWCQGETDGDLGTSEAVYTQQFDAMLAEMLGNGIERLLQIRIGQCNIPGAETRYQQMIKWQDRLAATRENVLQTSVCFAEMRDRSQMKDAFHYYQTAYNEAGEEAGRNAAKASKNADC